MRRLTLFSLATLFLVGAAATPAVAEHCDDAPRRRGDARIFKSRELPRWARAKLADARADRARSLRRLQRRVFVRRQRLRRAYRYDTRGLLRALRRLNRSEQRREATIEWRFLARRAAILREVRERGERDRRVERRERQERRDRGDRNRPQRSRRV